MLWGSPAEYVNSTQDLLNCFLVAGNCWASLSKVHANLCLWLIISAFANVLCMHWLRVPMLTCKWKKSEFYHITRGSWKHPHTYLNSHSFSSLANGVHTCHNGGYILSTYSASVELAPPLTLLYTSWICAPCFIGPFNVGVNPITQLTTNKCNIQLL